MPASQHCDHADKFSHKSNCSESREAFFITDTAADRVFSRDTTRGLRPSRKLRRARQRSSRSIATYPRQNFGFEESCHPLIHRRSCRPWQSRHRLIVCCVRRRCDCPHCRHRIGGSSRFRSEHARLSLRRDAKRFGLVATRSTPGHSRARAVDSHSKRRSVLHRECLPENSRCPRSSTGVMAFRAILRNHILACSLRSASTCVTRP
jgi:hypothetical protein